MHRISHGQAKAIIGAAFAKASELDLKPLSIAVLDPGGNLIAFERGDGASMLRAQIATGKAAGALALGTSSRNIADMAAERPAFFASIVSISPTDIVPAAGGLIVTDKDGTKLGAVGVTGDTSDNDELCAIAGIEAVGLIAQI